jgi:hypothetical protein
LTKLKGALLILAWYALLIRRALLPTSDKLSVTDDILKSCNCVALFEGVVSHDIGLITTQLWIRTINLL